MSDQPLTLGEKQRRFSGYVAHLIIQANARGFEVTLGDAFRDPRVFGEHGANSAHAYGRSRSCHKLRLAVDLNLFRDGEYLTSTDDHRPLGEWWEKLGREVGMPLRWGGRFNDGNHYSCEHRGAQ